MLTIVGGLFILGGGLVFALVGAILSLYGVWSGLFLIGVLVGLLTLIVGVLMIAVPSAHSLWGILALLFAFVSIPFALVGGFVIGFLLTLIGGILALTWRPPATPVVTVAARLVPPPA